jgi:hypothetical protein
VTHSRDPLPGEVWSRGGIHRLVMQVSDSGRVMYQVDLSPARVEHHSCSMATWLRWVREGASCLRSAQGELFPGRRR